MSSRSQPPVVLFGYDSSPLTDKVRLALRVKQVSFSYVFVSSVLSRPFLASTFALHYLKMPVLAIGREIYCDTSLIIEALEHFFPSSVGWGTVYPTFEALDEWTYKGLARGFNTTIGLIPSFVWSASFGSDCAQLTGHNLDPSKLEAKVPENFSNLDLHLSILESTFSSGTWAIPTKTPSLVDLSLYYQLRWDIDTAAGKDIYHLTGGDTKDAKNDVAGSVFNKDRYPRLWTWFHAFEAYINTLPDLETTIPESDTQWKHLLRNSPLVDDVQLLVPTALEQHPNLDVQRGLEKGVSVSIVPENTGREDPTLGALVMIGVEEVVITPIEKAEVDVQIHFPRLGFVIGVVEGSRL